MSLIFTPITTEAALGTDTAGASNVSSSEFVRLYNSAASDGAQYLVTLEESGGTDIGTFSLEAQKSVIIRKSATDKLFAANAAILACGVKIVDVAQPIAYSKAIN